MKYNKTLEHRAKIYILAYIKIRNMDDVTTIRVRKIDRDTLDKLRGRDVISSQIKYFEAMVNYFETTGLNPEEKVKSTAGELSKLRNTMVSFIRTQEEKKLDPIMKSLDELSGTLLDFMKKEALKKQEFFQFMEAQQFGKIDSENKEPDKTAKYLFNEFVSKMNQKMSGYSIDKKTLQHYKNQFELL